MASLHDVCRVESLRSAWNSLSKGSRANRARVSMHHGRFDASGGTDDISIEQFEANLEDNLRLLSSRLRDGRFRFSALTPVLVQKPNGKLRLICVPTVRDRIVQKALLSFLCNKSVDRCRVKNKVSFGFIPELGVKKAVQAACELRQKLPWVYKTDICAFFDSLDRRILAAAIAKTVRAKSLHNLLIAAIKCEVMPPSAAQALRIEALGIRKGSGIRQGMPLSPLFSNVMLKEFDRAIEQRGLAMVRYADDLLVLAESEEACSSIHLFVQGELAKIGLRIHELNAPDSKTQIFPPKVDAEFLGVAISLAEDGYRPVVLRTQIGHMKKQMEMYSEPEFLESKNLTISTLISRLDSLVAGYQGAYDFCANANQAFLALNDKRNQVLEVAIKRMLTLELSKMPERAKWFLGYRA